jgi:hypothetical protein
MDSRVLSLACTSQRCPESTRRPWAGETQPTPHESPDSVHETSDDPGSPETIPELTGNGGTACRDLLA